MYGAKLNSRLFVRTFLAIAIGLILRLVLAIYTPGNLDQQNFIISAQILRSGANIYNETPYYNYTPLWGGILALLSLVNIPLPILVRLTLIAADMANSWLISRTISAKASRSRATSARRSSSNRSSRIRTRSRRRDSRPRK